MRQQRAAFFLVAGIACLLLVPVAPAEFRWVAGALGGVYLVLSLLSWLDARQTG